jgi:hypothetical protein
MDLIFVGCLFAKDFSHKKREPAGSLFLCLVVKGTIERASYPADYQKLFSLHLAQLPPQLPPTFPVALGLFRILNSDKLRIGNRRFSPDIRSQIAGLFDQSSTDLRVS